MPRFGVSGGPRLGRQVKAGVGVAGPQRNLNYRQSTKYASFTYRWNGGEVLNMITRGTMVGMERVGIEAEREWREVVHVITGHLRDSMHIFVDVGRNQKVTLLATNDAPYADFEERGTIYREGHFPMRQTFQRVVPRINKIMAAAMYEQGFPPR